MENVRLYIPLKDTERVSDHLRRLFPNNKSDIAKISNNRFIAIIDDNVHIPTHEVYFELEHHPTTKEIEVEEFLKLNLEPSYHFEPFDKVLVKDGVGDNWSIDFFCKMDYERGRHSCMCGDWVYCVPYKGNESLVGG